jgi:hypothetical protein
MHNQLIDERFVAAFVRSLGKYHPGSIRVTRDEYTPIFYVKAVREDNEDTDTLIFPEEMFFRISQTPVMSRVIRELSNETYYDRPARMTQDGPIPVPATPQAEPINTHKARTRMAQINEWN